MAVLLAASIALASASHAEPLLLVHTDAKIPVGQPIRLHWTLANGGSSALIVVPPTDSMNLIFATEVTLEVVRPDSQRVELVSETGRSLGARSEELQRIRLEPGKATSGTFEIHEGSPWALVERKRTAKGVRRSLVSLPGDVFSLPGRYEVRVRLRIVGTYHAHQSSATRQPEPWKGSLVAGPIAFERVR